MKYAVAALVVAAVTACSASSTVPATHEAQFAKGLQRLRPEPGTAKSPCKIRGLWYFKASCTAFTMRQRGSTATLAASDGLTLTERFFKNAIQKPGLFVAGAGTGDKNITGQHDGVTFPEYGSVKCYDPYGRSSYCPGKAVLYTIVANVSDEFVSFGETPRFTLKTPGPLPGTECELTNITRTKDGSWAWILQLIYAKPRNGTVTFNPVGPATVDFPPNTFYLFGFICF